MARCAGVEKNGWREGTVHSLFLERPTAPIGGTRVSRQLQESNTLGKIEAVERADWGRADENL
jgi:hypothetical protein